MAVIIRKPRAKAAEISVELAKTVGARLRSLRKSQRVTLVELAKASAVDSATISRIETGKMSGTLESHMKLTRALGAKLTQLYAGIEEAQAAGAVAVQAPSRRTEVYVHQGGKASLAMLTPEVLKKKLMPVLITLQPGGSTQKEEARVGTEKFLYLLEGELEAKVGGTLHRLTRGTTLYFDASLPHQLRNVGAKAAKCLAVTTPPAL